MWKVEGLGGGGTGLRGDPLSPLCFLSGMFFDVAKSARGSQLKAFCHSVSCNVSGGVKMPPPALIKIAGVAAYLLICSAQAR